MYEFKDIPICGILADEIDVIPVIEETIDLGDVWMIQEVIDLDLSKNVLHNI